MRSRTVSMSSIQKRQATLMESSWAGAFGMTSEKSSRASVATLGEVAVISHLWVDADHRGGGLGTAIIDAAEAEALRRGCGKRFSRRIASIVRSSSVSRLRAKVRHQRSAQWPFEHCLRQVASHLTLPSRGRAPAQISPCSHHSYTVIYWFSATCGSRGGFRGSTHRR